MILELVILTTSALISGCVGALQPGEYDPRYGTFVGELSTLHHDVTGDVYAVDNTTLYIKDFSYDGEAPDAFFFAGNGDPPPSNRGFIIPDEKGTKDVLGPYRNRNLLLKFPVTKKGQRGFFDIKWFSVWCRRFSMDFGHVVLPKDMVSPAPQESNGGLSSDAPALVAASGVTLMDTSTILLKDFEFDGGVDDAIFVLGSGAKDAAGVQVPDARGSLKPLKKHKRGNLELTVPEEAQGKGVQYVGVWSPSVGMLASATFEQGARLPPRRPIA